MTAPDARGLRPLGRQAAEMARLLRILAHADRLRLLCRLAAAEGAGFAEPTVGELAALIGRSQSRVSQHLAQLRAAGVVGPRRQGQTVRYRLLDRRVRRVMDALSVLCEAGAPGRRG